MEAIKDGFSIKGLVQLARDLNRFELAKTNLQLLENTPEINDVIPQEKKCRRKVGYRCWRVGCHSDS